MERRQQILAAARRAFAKEGFHRTTIKKIALEAGLKSPSLVYWYFENKKKLFQAMVEELSPVLTQLPNFWERIDDPPEKMLLLIARSYLSTFDNPEARQLFRIFLSEAPRVPETANNFAEKIVLVLNFVITYLEHQIDMGILRPHDTQSSARSFMGSLVTYLMGREIFLPFRAGLPAQEIYAQEVVDIFLKGLRPK
ncbi:MAG: TetR/AcrR family transcriptional regulator [Dehalococcoidales bacterium]